MIKGANKNPEATVLCRAYDAQGETIDTMDYHGRMEPSIVFFEFYSSVDEAYRAGKLRRATRFTCDIVF